jgi:hypothetical protein
MSDIKLASALPKGQANGLSPIVLGLIEDPSRFRVVLAIVDCKSVTTDADTGETVPTARIRRIEAVLSADLDSARRLMARAMEHRTGRTMLPLDMEDEMRTAFDAESTP